MSNEIPFVGIAHPLGPLAPLAALAQEWHTRGREPGGTWAGLWRPEQQRQLLDTVEAFAERVDDATRSQLARKWALPGVRDYSLLLALLPLETKSTFCANNTTLEIEQVPEDGNQQQEEQEGEEQEPSVPIWHHGVLEQARISTVRHAVHLVRFLDDYHEPSLAALRRRHLRSLDDDVDSDKRRAAGEVAATTFLEKPTRWRDVVETAVHLATLRAVEAVLGSRIEGPGRTIEQLLDKIGVGLSALMLGGASSQVAQIERDFKTRLESLSAARVVLLYEEQQYLQLSGIRAGRSVRRHLPRGLHLIFTDQRHRREDRIAGLWLQESDQRHAAGNYHWAREVPPAYAARKRSAYFRLPDADAVRRYMEGQDDE